MKRAEMKEQWVASFLFMSLQWTWRMNFDENKLKLKSNGGVGGVKIKIL